MRRQRKPRINCLQESFSGGLDRVQEGRGTLTRPIDDSPMQEKESKIEEAHRGQREACDCNG